MPTDGPTLASLRVVVSDRAGVADDAMRLTHDVYVERGFLEPLPSGRRFVAPYVNPGTRFVVVYSGDEAIATATLVPDGPFGLPADRAFAEELDQLRAESDTRCEVSGLSVASMWRRKTRLLLGFLLGTVVRVNGLRGVGHRVVFVVEPLQAALMSSVLMGERSFGPRPLLGEPGTLMVTQDVSHYGTFFADPTGPSARALVAEYALDPNPTWLVDDPPTGDWRRVLLPRLVEESGLLPRLELQLDLVRGAIDAAPTAMVVV
ncbi:hypothetical protein BH23ACT10_BH23ACT10_11470 [soil metagenome]